VNAHSAVQVAPNDSWARRRLGLRALAEKARAESLSRFRMRGRTPSVPPAGTLR
jgi:hypothetical protein